MRLPLAVLVLVAVLALAAAPAQAGCGGVRTARPTKRLGDFRAPLIVGDSVLLGAVPQVAGLGFRVNTRGCRQWKEGQGVVLRSKRVGRLPHLVVMFLGADWTVSVKEIRTVMALLGPTRVLGLVTPRELGGRGGPDAQHMRSVAARFPTRVLLLDWVRFTAPHPRWFAPDGIHLGYGGARALARLLERALPYAAPGEFPGPKTEPAPQPQPDPSDPQQPAPPPGR